MLGKARLPSPPYARTDVSGNARRTSATVRAPDRSMSSRLITLTDAGVVLEGWGRFPGTMTSGSSNVGGSCGWDSGTCANASWIETAPTTTATHKNAQRPTRPLGPWCSIPPTSSAAKACGAGPYQLDSQARRLDDTYPVKLVRAEVRAGLLAPGSLSVSGLPKRPAVIRRRRSVACYGEGLPGYSGATAPELHRTSLHPHSWAQYSTDWECFPLEVSLLGAAPVGELKSWTIKEAAVTLQLSNSPTLQLPAFSAQ